MTIIEINALENGAHRNQTGDFASIPEGYAVIPKDMVALENFPFGKVIAEKIDGVMTMTKWIPGVFPEVVHEDENTNTEPTTEELLNIILGVSE